MPHDDTQTDQAALPPAPARIRLLRPHGFVENDTNRHRYWQAGEVITSPDEIELLRSRGAEYEIAG